jgi:abequosyltransferase
MPTIAICIPTYNRMKCLGELLDSIAAQQTPNLEVIVSDDASPDATAVLANSYKDKISNYTFIRQTENVGLDRNFLAVVEAARSDYIWLMGDDDMLEPGAVKRVTDALTAWPGVSGLTLGVIDYDVKLEKRVGIRAMPASQQLIGADTVFSRIAELLGFMSALVIDRLSWLEVANDPVSRDFQKYYIQVYIIGRVLGKTGKWGIVQEPCVKFRTGNDQFKSKFGWLDRLKIDVVAYEEIGDALFSDNVAAHSAMRRRVFDTHVMARLNNAKTSRDPSPGSFEAFAYLYKFYRSLPGFWMRGVPTLIAPRWAIRTARLSYKRFAKTSGAARARTMTEVSQTGEINR